MSDDCVQMQRDMDGDASPRFLCDEMLCRLGRWLRAAGYDTALAAPGTDDRSLVTQAERDDRWLLTRDRGLKTLERPNARIALLHSDALPNLVAEVTGLFGIDWCYRPFSRCLCCNSLLQPASPAQYHILPVGALAHSPEAWFCPRCAKLYWEGGHVRRMRHTLRNFSHHCWVIAAD